MLLTSFSLSCGSFSVGEQKVTQPVTRLDVLAFCRKTLQCMCLLVTLWGLNNETSCQWWRSLRNNEQEGNQSRPDLLWLFVCIFRVLPWTRQLLLLVLVRSTSITPRRQTCDPLLLDPWATVFSLFPGSDWSIMVFKFLPHRLFCFFLLSARPPNIRHSLWDCYQPMLWVLRAHENWISVAEWWYIEN